MPPYTVVTRENFLSVETKSKIAGQIARIHSTVMSVPRNFVRVVFLSCQVGSGYTAGTAAPLRQSIASCAAVTSLQRKRTCFANFARCFRT
jgi:phenylpyruvate tautomerase PptA (4-oxalocrotonate tautomerase family)